MYEDSSTAQYQVIGATPQSKDVWASFNSWTKACDYSQVLTDQLEGISFYVKDGSPAPTDEEVMAYFDHLDFGGA